MVKSGLTLAGDLLKEALGAEFGYISAISKLMLVWRDNARLIFDTWCDLFPGTAWRSAARVPPKAIVGRWGSISQCEQIILNVKFAELRVAFEFVFARDETPAEKRQRVLKRPAAAGQGDVPAGVEEAREYSQRMGKWKRDVLIGLHDARFERMANVADISRKQLDHMVHFLCKHRPAHTPLGLACLVQCQATRLAQDLARKCNLDDEDGPWPRYLATVPASDVDKVAHCAKVLTLHHLCDFERRVMGTIRQPHLRVLVLSKSLPEDTCTLRQSFCSDMLKEVEAGTCDPSILKLIRAFPDAFQDCQASGRLTAQLHILVSHVASAWMGDVQRIEGINSLIEIVTKRAPSISLALLDARISGIKGLGLGSRRAASQNRYGNFLPTIENSVAEAVDHAPDIDTVLGAADRWTSPLAIENVKGFHQPDATSQLALTCGRETAAWANWNESKFTTHYRREYLKSGKLGILRIGGSDASPQFYGVCLFYKYDAYFKRWEGSEASGAFVGSCFQPRRSLSNTAQLFRNINPSHSR